jgi:colicin import membrane protein
MNLELEKYQLEADTTKTLSELFQPFAERAEGWKEKATAIVVTDATQLTEMQQARDMRLELRTIRIDVEKTRKRLKEDSLNKGRAIDGVANLLKGLIEPLEEHLQEQEDFAKIAEAKRKAALKAVRSETLTKMDVVPSFYDLENMSKADFDNLVEGIQLARQAKIEADRKAEEERVAQEKAKAEEEARIRAENEKLKKEAEEKEKALALERQQRDDDARAKEARAEMERKAIEAEAAREKAKQDAIIAEERKAKEKLEREKHEAEAKAEKERKDKLAAEKKAAKAPDKNKLTAMALDLKEFKYPEVKSEEALKIVEDVKILIGKTINFILEKAEGL